MVRRFLAVLGDPFEYEEVKLTVTVDGKNFYAKGKTVKNAGWKANYGMAEDDEGEEERSQTLPPLRQGMTMMVQNAAVKAAKTKPPARYTEATLLTAMENPSGQISDSRLKSVMETTSGLGTPATRADIIEKLFDTFYVERRGKELVPTSKGKQLIGLVPPDLKSAELTAKWELELQKIAKGQAKSEAFVDEMRRYAAHLVSGVIGGGGEKSGNTEGYDGGERDPLSRRDFVGGS